MELLEVAVRKQVTTSGALGLVGVFAEMPFCVLGHPVLVDEGVVLIGAGSVLAPVVPIVMSDLAATQQPLRVGEGFLIQFHGHPDPFVTSGLRRCCRAVNGVADIRLADRHAGQPPRGAGTGPRIV
ncbi:hypothetical protein [Cryobacterium sp. M25]|uniref:hypothetical protein n=1 Tax=Cryobacterium sp. M25 TaxID=2048293 RepID=UPI001304FED5